MDGAVLHCVAARGLEQLMAAEQEILAGKAVAAPHVHSPMSMFYADVPPSISIQDYTARLRKYMKCSPECFVVALVLVRRFITLRTALPNDSDYLALDVHTVHRLYALACIVAAKMRDDVYYSMAYYAQVVGISHKKLLDMEVYFFSRMLRFDAGCTREVYLSAVDWLSQVAHPLDVHDAFASVGVFSRSTSSGLPSPVKEKSKSGNFERSVC